MKMIVSNKTTLVLMIFASLLMGSLFTMSAQETRTLSANQKYMGNVNATPDIRATYAKQDPTMRAFPNPASQNDVLTIQVFGMENNTVQVVLIESMTGQTVYENAFDNVAEMVQVKVHLVDIPSGQYALRVMGGKTTLNEMVLVR